MKRSRKILISIIALLTIVCSFYTIEAYTVKQYTIDTTMQTLISDDFKGRLAGTEGNDKAVDYITNAFEAFKLEKFDDDYYHESFKTIYHPEGQQHHLEVIFKDGTSKIYKYGEDYIDYQIKDNIDMIAKITFDPKDENLKDKILVLDKKQKVKVFSLHTKGVLQVKDRFFRCVGVFKKLKFPYVQISQNLYNDLKNKGVESVKYKSIYTPSEVQLKSVIGKISGKDSTKAVVISAHFDHVGWIGDAIYRGAIDNASGTAIILELAKKLNEQSLKEKFDMDIIIAAFNGEDSLIPCSEDFAKDFQSKYDELYNINIDCIGKKDGGVITLNGERKDTGLNDTLKEALIDCFTTNNIEVLDETYGFSDHLSFNERGISGVTIGQKDIQGENNTTSIHTIDDDMSIVDFKQIYDVVDAIYDFIITNDGTVFKSHNYTIEKTMRVLTSDEFKGRLVGTEGNDKTVDYITTVFKELELEEYDDDYYHEINGTIYHPDKQEHYLEVFFKDGTNKVYEYGADYVDSMIKEYNEQAKITFDPKDKNLKDKILVLDKDDKTKTYQLKTKGVFKERDTFFRTITMFKRNTPRVQISNNLYKDLTTKGVDYVKLKIKYVPSEKVINSVIGKIKGKDSSKAVVLSAHFDHVGWAGDTIFTGAVDNASGIATILELAKKLKDQSRKEPFDIDIIIAAFNGEEDLFIECSSDFVKDIEKQYDEFYNINIDCVGKKEGGQIVLSGEHEDTGLNTTLKEALQKNFSKYSMETIDKYGAYSDNIAFNNHDISSIMITQEYILGQNGTAKIHTPEDNITIIDFSHIKKVVDIIYDFIMENDGVIYKPSNK
ncbi:M28 family peptidase [Clostridiaceae bacterium M8S5]|nr:M28 family peptidase [Clostridiaceae bacterium M8S5]